MLKSKYDPESRFLWWKWNLTEENLDLKNKDLFLFWSTAIYLRCPGRIKKSPTNTSRKNKSTSTSFRPHLLFLWSWHILGLITRFFLPMVPLLNLPAIFMTKSLNFKCVSGPLNVQLWWKEAAVWWTWSETEESELHYSRYNLMTIKIILE